MRSTGLYALLFVVLAVSAVAPSHASRQATLVAGDYIRTSHASYQDIDMDSGQVEAMVAAVADMPAMSPVWTRAGLRNACRSPAQTGILSCNDAGFPTRVDAIGTGNGADKLSDHLANLTQLTYLSIAITSLSGTLPASWNSLSHLEYLYFSANPLFTGAIPDWSGMTSLKRCPLPFLFNQTEISPVPQWMAKLESISLSGVNFGTQDLPDSWFSSNTTTELSLNGVRWSGNIPAVLALNTVLRYLYIIMDTTSPTTLGAGKSIPTDLSATSLRAFAFQQHATSSFFPTAWPSSIETIQFFALPNMAGTIPQSLVNTPSLTEISVSEATNISGSLPGPSYLANSKMTTITLYNLGLTGSISPAWFSIPSLTSMLVSNMPSMNPFELGPFPSADDNLCGLQSLNLGSIQLSGTLPPALFSICPNLTVLNLHINNVVGAIPNDWSKSNGALSIKLSANRLTGTIPASMKWKSTDPSTFVAYDNLLTGSLPAGFANHNWRELDISFNNINVCTNIDTISSIPTCTFAPQVSSSNWCPCNSSWADVGCQAPAGDCSAAPSVGPSPLTALPPYTSGEPLPPAFYPPPPVAPTTPPRTAAVPTGTAPTNTFGFATILAAIASVALFLL